MANKTVQVDPDSNSLRKLTDVLAHEWKQWLAGALLSFFIASVLLSGWPQGLLPNVTYPFSYDGDGLSHAWISQRAIEGWVNNNIRSGYPFGSSFLDYPSSDAANYLIIKLIGTLSGEFYSAINLYILLSFSIVFVASYAVLRGMGLTKSFTFTASILYAFIPFHFQRIPHLFYMWYFVAPIFFYIAISLYFNNGSPLKLDRGNLTLYFIGILALSSFGVYYALFGTIVLAAISFIIITKTNSLKKTTLCGLIIATLMVGVLVNIGPNIYNTYVHGKNSEVAVRSPAESEIYGLKLMQLILPRADHRLESFAKVTNRYNANFPLVNENATSTLGLIGALGFIIAMAVLFRSAIRPQSDSRILVFSFITIVLFLFGTIGGLGALFSSTISASIRGWNRISIFIAFGSLAVFFLYLQTALTRFVSNSKKHVIFISTALIIGFVGIYDQTIPTCQVCNQRTKEAFERDRIFVQRVEELLPANSAIYQLPYMGFPEVPPKFRLHTYDHAAGFLHSQMLRWSYGGMKGRSGDLFFRSLANEPISLQIEVIKRLGFSGIYVDRRGFEDSAKALIAKINTELKTQPALVRADNEVVFYKFDNIQPQDLSSLRTEEIENISGYTPALATKK